jgi:dihydrofolate reductase
MRRIRYQVASSLDGYIAGPNGEYDWIVMDPDIDFGGLFAQFDTLVMGRKTYEVAQGGPGMGEMKVVVFSKTLRPEDHPGVRVVSGDVVETCRKLKEEAGKDIWLFGGGELFATLLEAGVVDTVELAIVPVLLGGGVSLLKPPVSRRSLELTGHRIYPKSGIVLLEYGVQPASNGKRARRSSARGKQSRRMSEEGSA